MAAAREHGKNASRDFEPLLDWLVTVGVYAERNRLWDIPWMGELLLEKLGRILLVKSFVSKSRPGERPI